MVDLPKVKRLSHLVLLVENPAASAEWYQRVLGMRISARCESGPYAGGYFMSFGVLDHDIALFPASAGAGKGKEFEHASFEVDCGGDLDRLRRLYGHLLQQKVRINEVLDHGVSIGVYFFDPDGHQLEVFCQIIRDSEAALAELAANQGKADPITLEPLFA